MVRPFAILLLLPLTLSVACRTEQPVSHSFPGAPVILISIDTLRSDRLPVYGYEGVETPYIDALRADGVLFEKAWSHCPMTLPSHVSMLTGLLPYEHRVRNNVGYRFDAAAHAHLPGTLKANGYATGASVSSYVLRSGTGMGEMFDEYDDEIAVGTEGTASRHQRPGGQAVAFAGEWIDRHANEPFFFLLHLYEPHAPYEPPEPFRSRYEDAYDGEIAASDSLVGEFLENLRKRGVYDRALIILTSDHGEGLMDHGEDQHGILLYREAIQVPLIVKLPGGANAGEKVAAPVQHIDLFPTVLALLGIANNSQTSGASLMDFPGDAGAPVREIYSETLYPRIHLGWSELRSIVSGSDHYIEAPKAELYDLAADPGEKVNRTETDRRRAAALRSELRKYPAAIEEIAQVDPEEARKLAALGYLGTPATREGGNLPNPMEEIGSLERIREAFRLADERKYDDAIPIFRALLERNPSMSEASDRLGEALLATGRHDDAIAVYRSAIQRAERFSSDMALSMANALLVAGKLDEARSHAELAVSSNPMRAHELLARVALRRGNLEEAERSADMAIDGSRRQPSVMLLRAEIRRAAGDLPGALQVLEAAERRAAEMGVSRLRRLEYLRGDVLARMGRQAEAEEAYRKAIVEFPDDLQSYANLAVIYFVQGETAQVRSTLDAMVAANPNQRARKLAKDTLASFDE